MNIIGTLKRLIFGARVEPVEQVTTHVLQQPKQVQTMVQTTKSADNEQRYSESDILAVQKRAETSQRAFNESLSIANQSKNRGVREYRLHIAREALIELKILANKFPFLHLENLQEVEASIIKVQAETSSLSYSQVANTSINDVPDKAQPKYLIQRKDIDSLERSGKNRQNFSASDEQAILIYIQSSFRVVNESIEIARKSKNLETKLSRLGVARNSLKEAQRQASQFSLEVGGFDEAEAEISRIDEAIKTGTPTAIAGMQQIDANAAYSSAARSLLMEATALKREKKYFQACAKLREAYSADGAENLTIEERLRLPMYLQLAGKNDEGWVELNRLDTRYVDQFSQPIIAHQMRIFLRKEKNETAMNPVRVILRRDNKRIEATGDANTTGDVNNGDTLSVNATQPMSKIFTTIEESQNNKIELWKANQDVIKGMEFIATMQLRTPLRVLLRHGEIHTNIETEMPKIAMAMWEGIWVPKTVLSNYFPSGTHASSIGQIMAGDYLPFLISIRKIVELNDSIVSRIGKLREMLSVCNWQEFLGKHGGIEKIIGNFFPRFIDTIPKITDATISELARLRLDTPNRIAAATDAMLLSIKGVGRAKLQEIREHCADIAEHRDADRIENVTR